MNLLAHAFLSFGEPEVLVGNMISDYVKGRKQYDYPPGIFKGIRLHRGIDDFTDSHPITMEAKRFFRPFYRLYAGAFIDIVYDHFLALDPLQFTDAEALAGFAAQTYQTLNGFRPGLPQQFQMMLPYMEKHNWLYHYREPEGIRKSFNGMVQRSAYMQDSAPAFEIFMLRYKELQEYYQAFFPALKVYARERLLQL